MGGQFENLLSFLKMAGPPSQVINDQPPTIKFTAEISETEITFSDTKVYKGDRFHNESILYANALLNNLRRPFNTRISIRVTHQASRKALSNERLYRKIPRKQHLRKTLKTSNHAKMIEGTQLVSEKKNTSQK